MSDLRKYFENAGSKTIKWAHYFDVYEAAVAKFRDQSPLVVEVGVLHGGSLEMWAKYFGQGSTIVGVDIRLPEIDVAGLNRELMDRGHGQVHMVQGNAESAEFWQDFYTKFANVDVFIDDGGHTNTQQIVAVTHAIKHTSSSGVIICEDTMCSFDWRFGNPHRYSFHNYIKTILDCQSKTLIRKTTKQRILELQRDIKCITFYPGIILVQKASTNIDDFRIVDNGGSENHVTSSAAPSFTSKLLPATLLAHFSHWLNSNQLRNILRLTLVVAISFQRKVANWKNRKYFW